MTFTEIMLRLQEADPNKSYTMCGKCMERHHELRHKGFKWRAFYNGWLEGVLTVANVLADNEEVRG